MERDLAERLIKKLTELGAPFDDATELVDEIADDEERKRFRKGLGEVMALAYTDLMIPILRQYPELDPDKDFVFEKDDPLRLAAQPGQENLRMATDLVTPNWKDTESPSACMSAVSSKLSRAASEAFGLWRGAHCRRCSP